LLPSARGRRPRTSAPVPPASNQSLRPFPAACARPQSAPAPMAPTGAPVAPASPVGATAPRARREPRARRAVPAATSSTAAAVRLAAPHAGLGWLRGWAASGSGPLAAWWRARARSHARGRRAALRCWDGRLAAGSAARPRARARAASQTTFAGCRRARSAHVPGGHVRVGQLLRLLQGRLRDVRGRQRVRHLPGRPIPLRRRLRCGRSERGSRGQSGLACLGTNCAVAPYARLPSQKHPLQTLLLPPAAAAAAPCAQCPHARGPRSCREPPVPPARPAAPPARAARPAPAARRAATSTAPTAVRTPAYRRAGPPLELWAARDWNGQERRCRRAWLAGGWAWLASCSDPGFCRRQRPRRRSCAHPPPRPPPPSQTPAVPSCPGGSYAAGSACAACKAGCATCVDGTTCASCPAGQYLYGGACGALDRGVSRVRAVSERAPA
jgi:hypothetical protein